jgi:Ca2+:H+ antiporter
MVEKKAAAWVWLVPAVSVILLAAAVAAGVGPFLALLCGASLIGAVIAAVHHAEVVAHRVGEPFGTLVLALAVTVIEASLILSMMLGGKEDIAILPRDTIYAAVIIIFNGVMGLCILIGSLSHHEQAFRVEGAGAGLAATIAMGAITLVLPAFAVTGPGGALGVPLLVFVAVASGALWAIFVFAQTVRHRDYFLPVMNPADPDEHAELPTIQATWTSFWLLLVSLVSVVGLAKVLSPTIEHGLEAVGAPKAAIGILIAVVVLLPETWAAVRAARADRLQTSMNLAMGSAIACIGLTVPAVVVAAIAFGLPLELGLGPKEMTVLTLTFLVSTVTLTTGRTHLMQGAIHLVIFGAFLFVAFFT